MPFPNRQLQITSRRKQMLKFVTRYSSQQTAVRAGYPFQTFRDQCVYCYTGDVGKSLL